MLVKIRWAEGAISWAYYRGIAWPGRHHAGNNYAFVDGHVKWLRYTNAVSNNRHWNH